MTVLAVVGTGLIGGSFALAAKANGLFDRVVGHDASDRALEEALNKGVIDDRFSRGDHVDAICVAIPTQRIANVISDLAQRYSNDLPIFDVGSVKKAILDRLDPIPENFVPCHPIAGSHQGGPGEASSDLFRDKPCVITPCCETARSVLRRVRDIWSGVGAQVIEQSPERHDHALALTSHLPHLVSFALVDILLEQNSDYANQIGSGFRDMTRIAASDPEVWSDILADNQESVDQFLSDLQQSMKRLQQLARSEPVQLRKALQKIQAERQKLDR